MVGRIKWRALLLAGLVAAAGAEEKRRLEVLFFGDDDHHRPQEMYRLFKEASGERGINLSYAKRMEALNPEYLANYDVVLVFANHQIISPEQLAALDDHVKGGRGLMPVHCGSACFKKTDGYVALVGGQIEGHGEGVFTARVVAPEHPAMKGYVPFETWDETYRHHRMSGDLTILMRRDEEPWTWVREHGRGRVFYTAHGHDQRCWSQAGFHDLLERGIRWAAGDGDFVTGADLPELEYRVPLLPSSYQTDRPVPRVQEPLAAEESLKLAQVPAGFGIGLFASEPQVVNPIAMAWDEKGRLHVVEALDYPNRGTGTGRDRVKRCEDTDGDGRADRFTVFADGLSLATSVVAADGGLIVADGTRMLFLKDLDGDGVADQREILFEGFKIHDTHAGVSNLRYGFDGWIWATVGYAGFDGEVGGERMSFDTGVFRFRPDGSRLEFLEKTTNNTWGLGFADEFEVVGSTANRQPGWQLAGDGGKTRISSTGDLLFPTSVDVSQSDSWDGPLRELGDGRTAAYAHRFTAAAGFAPVTGGRFSDEWKDKAFVCEPTGHLVATLRMEWDGPDGSVSPDGNNLYASSDAWSAPVAAEIGPDGAVWIADWYNIIVQHNRPGAPFETTPVERGGGGAYVTPLRDRPMGRIYRVYPKGTADGQAPEDWIAGLEHPNRFWRLTSQRMLVEKGGVPRLKPTVHGLWAMAGSGRFEHEGTAVLAEALKSGDAALRRTALAVWPTGPEAIWPELDVDAEEDRFVLREWLRLASRWRPDEGLGRKLRMMSRSKPVLRSGEVIERCYAAAAARQATGFLLAALELEPDPEVFGERIFPAAIGSLRTVPSPQVRAAAEPLDSPLARRIKEVLAERPVKKDHEVPLARLAAGEAVYRKTCIACHQADGAGTPGAFPKLDGAASLTGDPETPIRIVLHGLTGAVAGIKGVMPPVAGLSDAEIADVLSYARHAWSNDARPVSEAEVSGVRERNRTRSSLWTLDELK